MLYLKHHLFSVIPMLCVLLLCVGQQKKREKEPKIVGHDIWIWDQKFSHRSLSLTSQLRGNCTPSCKKSCLERVYCLRRHFQKHCSSFFELDKLHLSSISSNLSKKFHQEFPKWNYETSHLYNFLHISKEIPSNINLG